MAIKLRNNQVAKLTATDYDNALSQLVYSGSVSGSSSAQSLLLHFTGSSAIDYSPRSTAISLPDTTYTISTHDQGSNAIIRLNPSEGSATEVKLVAGTGISVTPDNGTGNITLDVNFPSDNNTTYTVAATTATGGANLALSGSNSVFDAVKFASGTNVTVARTDANTITVSSIDTTYSAGNGLALNSTTFSLDTGSAHFISGTRGTFSAGTNVSIVNGVISSTDTNTDVDVSVGNLQSRLGEISSNTTVGDATDVTVTFAGDVIVNGALTATEVFTNIISSSVSFASGSTIFGDAVVDTHQFTGSVDISGSFKLRGTLLDKDGDAGSNGQMLVSTGTGINWVNATSGYSGWTVSDGTNSENIASTDTVTISGSGATSVSYDTGTNKLTISSTDTNTTYSQATDTTLGLVKIGYTENGKNYPVELSSGQMYVNVPWTDTDTDTNTTYSISAETVSGGANLRLTDSSAGTDDVKFASGTNVTVTRTDANTITISSTDTDTNTTYSISAETVTGGANLRLTDSGAGTDDVKIASGTNVTVTRTDANTITISSTDTNTTYSAGDGLGLSGTTFSLDTPGTLSSTSTNGVSANSHTHAITTTTNGTASTIVATDSNSEITAANFITTSDRRLKSDIEPIKDGLDTIKKFVSYEYIKGGLKEAGFIAQEVQEALPYAVREGEDGFLKMTDRAILAHIHKAVLQLEEKINIIEEKLK